MKFKLLLKRHWGRSLVTISYTKSDGFVLAYFVLFFSLRRLLDRTLK